MIKSKTTIYKILFILSLSMGLIFARSGRNNPTVDKKNRCNDKIINKDKIDNKGSD